MKKTLLLIAVASLIFTSNNNVSNSSVKMQRKNAVETSSRTWPNVPNDFWKDYTGEFLLELWEGGQPAESFDYDFEDPDFYIDRILQTHHITSQRKAQAMKIQCSMSIHYGLFSIK